MCYLFVNICSYPNPSTFTYENRFFRPFEYALQPPPWYRAEHIALDKPEVPVGVSRMNEYDGPQCFIIPGNHGLHTVLINLISHYTSFYAYLI
jgi:hypothetical protein